MGDKKIGNGILTMWYKNRIYGEKFMENRYGQSENIAFHISIFTL